MTDSKGQRHKECEIPFCKEKGRILAKMGNIELAYCPKHRKKYGERIINALVNSLFNYKLSNFMEDVKNDVFFDTNMLCDECAGKLKQYIIEKTSELEQILEWGEDNGISNETEVGKEQRK